VLITTYITTKKLLFVDCFPPQAERINHLNVILTQIGMTFILFFIES